jgi:hypothetical protein
LLLLSGKEAIDNLLLRLILAHLANGDLAHASRFANELEDRFSAGALRGDTVHKREEAVFALNVKKDPARALKLARENWVSQKEPADALLLLQAALAAHDIAALDEIKGWYATTHLEDVRAGPYLAAELKRNPTV